AGATFDVSAPATGRLIERHAWPRDVLSPGQVLGVMESEEASGGAEAPRAKHSGRVRDPAPPGVIMFFSLDGLDGTGKSTQCRLLADWLRASGHAVTPCIDPGGTSLGGQLRSLVLHHRPDIDRMCEALLFMASRAQLLAEVIRPALEAGQIV